MSKKNIKDVFQGYSNYRNGSNKFFFHFYVQNSLYVVNKLVSSIEDEEDLGQGINFITKILRNV